MGAMQRRKGARIEREAAKFLTGIGFPATRAARNGVDGGEDIMCESLPGIRFEVKGNEAIDIGTQGLWTALVQASVPTGGKRGVVLWKHNRSKWRLTWADKMTGAIVTCGEKAIGDVLNVLNREITERKDAR